jgi:tetratricopeptide (TPR) repeat protein
MDMEVPFLFTNEDMYVATKVFADGAFLKQFVAEHDPSFIIMPINAYGLKETMKGLIDYRPIFFDVSFILYGNKRDYPEVIDRYELKAIDPWSLPRLSTEEIKRGKEDRHIIEELERVVEVDKDNGLVHNCLALIDIGMGEYKKAEYHADAIIRNYPESPEGYRLKGDALKGLKEYDMAIKSYKSAIKRVDSVELHREIGLIYIEQKRYKEAYKTLIKAFNIYAPYTTYKDLYYVVLSAIHSGNTRDAEIIFSYAYKGLRRDDREWVERYEQLKKALKIQERPPLSG